MIKILINIGGTIATLLMFTPVYLILNHEKFATYNFIFYLICSILYDVYLYNIIIKESQFKNDKDHYYNWIKTSKGRAKKLKIKMTDKEEKDILVEHIESHYKKFTK